jgi:protein-tyrosine-phosphatase
MVKEADLIITALPEQKEELINLFPKAQAKIFTMREMSKWDGYLFFEDFKIVPMDDTFWDYVEGNPDYVSKVISLTEETLIRAFPNILKQFGVRE